MRRVRCHVHAMSFALTALLAAFGFSALGPTPVSLAETSASPGESSALASPLDVAAVHPSVNISTRHEYYDVTGQNGAALVSQMRRLGPRDDAESWAATTRWSMSWSFGLAGASDACAVTAPKVNLALTYTYPRWTPPADAPAGLQDRWDRFVTALAEHENGHGEIAVQGVNDLHLALQNVPAQASCADAARAADETAAAIASHYRALQDAYDRDTGHGTTQGAVWR